MGKAFEKELKKRGGAIGWRTMSLPNGEFQRVAITRKPGPRGGTTLAEAPQKRKRLRA